MLNFSRILLYRRASVAPKTSLALRPLRVVYGLRYSTDAAIDENEILRSTVDVLSRVGSPKEAPILDRRSLYSWHEQLREILRNPDSPFKSRIAAIRIPANGSPEQKLEAFRYLIHSPVIRRETMDCFVELSRKGKLEPADYTAFFESLIDLDTYESKAFSILVFKHMTSRFTFPEIPPVYLFVIFRKFIETKRESHIIKYWKELAAAKSLTDEAVSVFLRQIARNNLVEFRAIVDDLEDTIEIYYNESSQALYVLALVSLGDTEKAVTYVEKFGAKSDKFLSVLCLNGFRMALGSHGVDATWFRVFFIKIFSLKFFFISEELIERFSEDVKVRLENEIQPKIVGYSLDLIAPLRSTNLPLALAIYLSLYANSCKLWTKEILKLRDSWNSKKDTLLSLISPDFVGRIEEMFTESELDNTIITLLKRGDHNMASIEIAKAFNMGDTISNETFQYFFIVCAKANERELGWRMFELAAVKGYKFTLAPLRVLMDRYGSVLQNRSVRATLLFSAASKSPHWTPADYTTFISLFGSLNDYSNAELIYLKYLKSNPEPFDNHVASAFLTAAISLDRKVGVESVLKLVESEKIGLTESAYVSIILFFVNSRNWDAAIQRLKDYGKVSPSINPSAYKKLVFGLAENGEIAKIGNIFTFLFDHPGFDWNTFGEVLEVVSVFGMSDLVTWTWNKVDRIEVRSPALFRSFLKAFRTLKSSVGATAVFKVFERNHTVILDGDYEELIGVFGDIGDLEMVEKTFQKALLNNCSNTTFAALFRALIQLRKYSKVLEYFEDWKRSALLYHGDILVPVLTAVYIEKGTAGLDELLPQVTYVFSSLVIQHFLENILEIKGLEAANASLAYFIGRREIRKRLGAGVHNVIIDHMTESCDGPTLLAHVRKTVLNSKILPNWETFEIILRAFQRTEDLDLAVSFIEELPHHIRSRIPFGSFIPFFELAFSLKKFDVAWVQFVHLRDHDKLPKDILRWLILVRGFSADPKPRVFQILDEIAERFKFVVKPKEFRTELLKIVLEADKTDPISAAKNLNFDNSNPKLAAKATQLSLLRRFDFREME